MSTTKQIIDLSVSIDPAFWEPEPIRREVIHHREGADKLGRSYLYFQESQLVATLLDKII